MPRIQHPNYAAAAAVEAAAPFAAPPPLFLPLLFCLEAGVAASSLVFGVSLAAFAAGSGAAAFCGVAMTAGEAAGGAVLVDGVSTVVALAEGAAPCDFRPLRFLPPLAAGADWLSTVAEEPAGVEGATAAAAAVAGAGDANASAVPGAPAPPFANSRLAFLFNLGASPPFDPSAVVGAGDAEADADVGPLLLPLRFLRLCPFSAGVEVAGGAAF